MEGIEDVSVEQRKAAMESWEAYVRLQMNQYNLWGTEERLRHHIHNHGFRMVYEHFVRLYGTERIDWQFQPEGTDGPKSEHWSASIPSFTREWEKGNIYLCLDRGEGQKAIVEGYHDGTWNELHVQPGWVSDEGSPFESRVPFTLFYPETGMLIKREVPGGAVVYYKTTNEPSYSVQQWPDTGISIGELKQPTMAKDDSYLEAEYWRKKAKKWKKKVRMLREELKGEQDFSEGVRQSNRTLGEQLAQRNQEIEAQKEREAAGVEPVPWRTGTPPTGVLMAFQREVAKGVYSTDIGVYGRPPEQEEGHFSLGSFYCWDEENDRWVRGEQGDRVPLSQVTGWVPLLYAIAGKEKES